MLDHLYKVCRIRRTALSENFEFWGQLGARLSPQRSATELLVYSTGRSRILEGWVGGWVGGGGARIFGKGMGVPGWLPVQLGYNIREFYE